MFHHSSGIRNNRSKGSNPARILQGVALLAVACWLIYQVKHSHEKKPDFASNNEIKLSKGTNRIYLGRKGDAGSENVVIVDPNAQDFDQITESNASEVKNDEVQHDSDEIFHNQEIENSEKTNLISEKKSSPEEKQSDFHVNDREETLRLPNERERDNFDENVRATVEVENVQTDGHDQTGIGENAEKQIEIQNGEFLDDNLSSMEGVDSYVKNASLSETLNASSANHQADDSGDASREVSEAGEAEIRPENTEFESGDSSLSEQTEKIDNESENEIEKPSTELQKSTTEVQSFEDESNNESVESHSDSSSDTATSTTAEETALESSEETKTRSELSSDTATSTTVEDTALVLSEETEKSFNLGNSEQNIAKSSDQVSADQNTGKPSDHGNSEQNTENSSKHGNLEQNIVKSSNQDNSGEQNTGKSYNQDNSKEQNTGKSYNQDNSEEQNTEKSNNQNNLEEPVTEKSSNQDISEKQNTEISSNQGNLEDHNTEKVEMAGSESRVNHDKQPEQIAGSGTEDRVVNYEEKNEVK